MVNSVIRCMPKLHKLTKAYTNDTWHVSMFKNIFPLHTKIAKPSSHIYLTKFWVAHWET